MKVCFWDLETSHLKANFGHILCCGVKPYEKKPFVLVRDNLPSSNDKELCREIRDTLNEYDILVGFYSLGFDLKEINSRLMRWGLKPMDRKLHIDLFGVCKKIFNLHRRSLHAICEHLDIKGKGHVEGRLWQEAAYDGNKAAYKWIVNHCRDDVRVLEPLLNCVKWEIRGIPFR